MNRYFRSLGVTLFFYSVCGGIWMFFNAFPHEKKLIVTQESVCIKVSKEAIPEPQVAPPTTIPLIESTPPIKEQKQKAIASTRKTLPSPLVKTIEKEENLSSVAPPKEEVSIPKQIDSQSLHVKQQSYLQQVKERINQHKAYPKIAHKRSIEGAVVVEFTISPKGELLSYVIIDGQTLFIKSAEEAIVKSFPFLMEEELFTQSQTIQIKIIYNLI